MRSTVSALAGIAAALMIGLSPAWADLKVGAWLIIANDSDHPIGCMAATYNRQPDEILLAAVDDLGVIKFMVRSSRFALTPGETVEAELLVDGRPVSLSETKVLDRAMVGLSGTAKGRLEGGLLRAVEQGNRAVIQLGGIYASFNLNGSKEAMRLLSQCDMNDGVMPDAPALTSDASPSEASASSVGRMIGNWNVSPSEPYFASGCLAARMNSDGAALLLHQERPQAGVSFGVGSDTFDRSSGWKGATELIVDGQSIPFPTIRALDRSTLFSAESTDSAGFIERMRGGRSVTFTYEGETFRFDLEGFAETIPAFAECVAANDRTFASVQTGNRTNQALGITLAPEVSASAGSLGAADLEEEEEDGPSTSNADPMAALLDREEAYAQLRCSIPAINLVGLYGANARPIGFDIAINDDATASVQGTPITAVGQRAATSGSGPAVGVYRARDVYGAVSRSPLADMFANAPRPPQDAFEKGFMEMMTNPGSLVPENRLLSVSLLNNEVTVADQLSNGEFGNITTHRCLRLR